MDSEQEERMDIEEGEMDESAQRYLFSLVHLLSTIRALFFELST